MSGLVVSGLVVSGLVEGDLAGVDRSGESDPELVRIGPGERRPAGAFAELDVRASGGPTVGRVSGLAARAVGSSGAFVVTHPNACDIEGLVAVLRRDRVRSAAFAAAMRVEPDELESTLSALVPVETRRSVQVELWSFTGEAEPTSEPVELSPPQILLADPVTGELRVRCLDGRPIEELVDLEATGTAPPVPPTTGVATPVSSVPGEEPASTPEPEVDRLVLVTPERSPVPTLPRDPRPARLPDEMSPVSAPQVTDNSIPTTEPDPALVILDEVTGLAGWPSGRVNASSSLDRIPAGTAPEEPVPGGPASDEPASGGPASDEPVPGESSVPGGPAPEEPASDEPASDEPASEETLPPASSAPPPTLAADPVPSTLPPGVGPALP